MKPLKEFLSGRDGTEIQALAHYIQQNVDGRWQRVLEDNRGEFRHKYDELGEPAYGVFASILFRPIREQLESASFISEPRFPGTLAASEEWGPMEERERWMWSVVRREREAALGTVVVRLFHDHTQFRLPRPPEIFALNETDAEAIGREISRAATHRNGDAGR
jgi:hypothetical protein